MGDVDDEDQEVAVMPEGFPKEIWALDAFEHAAHEEGLSRDALVALEVLKVDVAHVRRLHMTTRLTGDEYIEKIVLLTGQHPDKAEAELEKRRTKRDDLLRTVVATMECRQAAARGAFPLPSGLTTETIALSSFAQACRFLGVSPAALARPEEFNPKADRAVERTRLKAVEVGVMKEARAIQAGNISWIKEAMGRIEEQEKKERRLVAGGEAARARFMVEMTAKIDIGIARERLKAEQALGRQRMQLEQLLIQTGIEEEMRRVQAGDLEVAKATAAHSMALSKEGAKPATAAHSMALSKEGAKPVKIALANAKNLPTHVDVISRETAAVERRKLFLLQRTRNARSVGSANFGNTTPKSDASSEAETRFRATLERRQALLDARTVKVARANQEKEESLAGRMARIAAERKKVLELSKKRGGRILHGKEEREWAEQRRSDLLQGKLALTEQRQEAAKDLRERERDARIEIQAEVQANANQIRKLAEKMDGDNEFDGLAWAREHGIEVDQSRIEEQIRQQMSKRLATPDSISVPVTDNLIPASTPSRHRPVSAPPGGPSDGARAWGAGSQRPASAVGVRQPGLRLPSGKRPGTAGSRRPGSALPRMPEEGRDFLRDPLRQFEEEDTAAERLEAMRIAQEKNLHRVVVDEQQKEGQRQEMLAAVQPAQRGTLARLFDHERAQATERIMRMAAENEMVLLQEMAMAASAIVPHEDDGWEEVEEMAAAGADYP
ncbi:hypothetical protein T484DRAFT_1904777 [Baffinella frigidus]|nr:hypothetical protein T484DRAFT_1904777 [Cryptophyta sp. CCMP2293]